MHQEQTQAQEEEEVDENLYINKTNDIYIHYTLLSFLLLFFFTIASLCRLEHMNMVPRRSCRSLPSKIFMVERAVRSRFLSRIFAFAVVGEESHCFFHVEPNAPVSRPDHVTKVPRLRTLPERETGTGLWYAKGKTRKELMLLLHINVRFRSQTSQHEACNAIIHL